MGTAAKSCVDAWRIKAVLSRAERPARAVTRSVCALRETPAHGKTGVACAGEGCVQEMHMHVYNDES